MIVSSTDFPRLAKSRGGNLLAIFALFAKSRDELLFANSARESATLNRDERGARVLLLFHLPKNCRRIQQDHARPFRPAANCPRQIDRWAVSYKAQARRCSHC
jgi:hypothetical protein